MATKLDFTHGIAGAGEYNAVFSTRLPAMDARSEDPR